MRSNTGRVVAAIAVLATILGIAFRVENAIGKIYYQDESTTTMRATGHRDADEQRLFNGTPRSYAAVQAIFLPTPTSGPAATIESLAAEDPHHPPAFYVLESLAGRVIGYGPLAMRAVPIVLGLSVLPLAYLLALELFASFEVACISVAMYALSPFFVLYGYQAREYSFYASVTLLASWLFLRAERLRGARDWSAYAAAIGLGIYVDLFFVFVILSHAIVAIFESYRSPLRLRAFFIAAVCGSAVGAPWLLVVLRNASVATNYMSWATQPYPFPLMLVKWLYFAGANFFDLEYVKTPLALVAAAALAIVAFAIFRFAREGDRRAQIFLASLGGTTFVLFAGSDLVLQHRLSTIGRYLTPTWIALVMAVAAYAGNHVRERTAQFATAFLLLCAVSSDAVSARNTSWWENSGNKSVPALAERLRSRPGLLVISIRDAAPMLVLAPLMPQNATWIGYGLDDPPLEGSRPAAPYLLLSPTDAERARLARAGVRLHLAYDSHDFAANVTKMRGAGFGEHAGSDDWGETVLYEVTPQKRGAI